jgi:hypothetical protein
VEPSTASPVELRRVLNVATHSKRIVYTLVSLGEVIADVANRIIGDNLISKDFVKLSQSQLDYEGWWNGPSVAPITRHVPLTIGQSRFLERCKDLNALIIEGLNERNLHTLLLHIGVSSKFIKILGV